VGFAIKGENQAGTQSSPAWFSLDATSSRKFKLCKPGQGQATPRKLPKKMREQALFAKASFQSHDISSSAFRLPPCPNMPLGNRNLSCTPAEPIGPGKSISAFIETFR
jgi:hypothetical protein